MQVPNHVQEHIDTIAKHEQEFLSRRSPAERLGDLTAAIVGNLGFVATHIVPLLVLDFRKYVAYTATPSF